MNTNGINVDKKELLHPSIKEDGIIFNDAL